MDSLEDGLPYLFSLMNQANFYEMHLVSKAQETSHKMSPVTSRCKWSYYRITPINDQNKLGNWDYHPYKRRFHPLLF